MTEGPLFETILASTVHDMKNSLSLLASNFDTIEATMPPEKMPLMSAVKYEMSRVNISLMELLALYKLEKRQLGVEILEVVLQDFIEDSVAAFSQQAENNNIRLINNCDDTMIWFFDPNLVGIAINNIIGNCIRYTSTTVKISVTVEDRYLVLVVADDGDGYPDSMLGNSGQQKNMFSYTTGSTGLGLYFAETIAACHKRADQKGYTTLLNGKEMGGGYFKMYLP